MSSEFDLIRRYFAVSAPSAILGVGDDAALLAPAPELELAVATDMLVAGTHFFPDADPYKLGRKALAVNLSDMAAMGATPRWALLALALPQYDERWLERFSAGLSAMAREYGVELIGGDTTRGPLNICVEILGEVPRGQALKRDGARPGDDVWVSGELGAAALGVAHLRGEITLPGEQAAQCLARLDDPTPRVALGIALRALAHSAIDISDGLAADLGHILERSKGGAEIEFARIPAAAPALIDRLDTELGRRALLAGGDDYELCFTAAPERAQDIARLGATTGVPVTRIGRITPGSELRVLDTSGKPMAIAARGFDHFA